MVGEGKQISGRKLPTYVPWVTFSLSLGSVGFPFAEGMMKLVGFLVGSER